MTSVNNAHEKVGIFQKMFNQEKSINVGNLHIEFWTLNEKHNTEYIVGRCFINNVLKEEKIFFYYNLEDGKLEAEKYFINSYLKNSLLNETMICNSINESISVDYINVDNIFISENKNKSIGNCLAKKAFTEFVNNKNMFTDYLYFNNFKNKELINTIENFKKVGFNFYFIDRSIYYGLPMIECILLNKNFYGNTFYENDLEKHLIKQTFVCNPDFEDGCLDAIRNIIFDTNVSYINLSVISLDEKIGTPFNNSQYFSPNFVFGNQNCNIFEKDIFDNHYFISILKENMLLSAEKNVSYEDYLINMLQLYGFNVYVNLYALKNDILPNVSILVLLEYIICMKIVEENKLSEYQLKADVVQNKKTPNVYSNKEKSFDFITAIYMYICYKAGEYRDEKIFKYMNMNFSDKNISQFIKDFINGEKTLWENPYIFKITEEK